MTKHQRRQYVSKSQYHNNITRFPEEILQPRSQGPSFFRPLREREMKREEERPWNRHQVQGTRASIP